MAKSKDTLKTRRERRTIHELHFRRAHSIASIALADNKFPCCIELTAITWASQYIAIVCCPFHSFVESCFRSSKINKAIHALSHSTGIDSIHNDNNELFCLLSIVFIGLLSLHNRLVCLHTQSVSTNATSIHPHPLFPHCKLQANCSLNTLLAFDRCSKPHR